MTDAYRTQITNAHNTLRSIVAKGNAANKNGTNLPQATNMYQMTYSMSLESDAQAWANNCNYSHYIPAGEGQNIAAIATNNTASPYAPIPNALNGSLNSWYNELRDNGQASIYIDASDYSHFTQVAWAGSSAIGCAVKNCPSMNGYYVAPGWFYTFIVCNYSPQGNMLGNNMYNVGASASACPSGSTAVSSTGLCAINGVAAIHA